MAAAGAKTRGSTPSAVLLSRQDFEALRLHAFPTTSGSSRDGRHGLQHGIGASLSKPSLHQQSLAAAAVVARPPSLVRPRGRAGSGVGGVGGGAAGNASAAAQSLSARRPPPGAASGRPPRPELPGSSAAALPARPQSLGRPRAGGSSNSGSAASAAGCLFVGSAPKLASNGRPPRPESLPPMQPSQDGNAIVLPSGRTLEVVAQAAPRGQKESQDGNASPAVLSEDAFLSDEEEDEPCAATDGEDAFDYREYSYAKLKETRRKDPASQQAQGKRTRGVARAPRELSPNSRWSCAEPWGAAGSGGYPGAANSALRKAPDPALGYVVEPANAACMQEDEAFENGLERIARAVITFYGFPSSDMQRAVRYRCNAVLVDEQVWERRSRTSQLESPPTFWLRGGRVYDFHGDRGTLAEFEDDLIVRQVEDDPICRQRRREQGLMPFPFAATPLAGKDEEDDASDDKPSSREGRRR